MFFVPFKIEVQFICSRSVLAEMLLKLKDVLSVKEVLVSFISPLLPKARQQICSVGGVIMRQCFIARLTAGACYDKTGAQLGFPLAVVLETALRLQRNI